MKINLRDPSIRSLADKLEFEIEQRTRAEQQLQQARDRIAELEAERDRDSINLRKLFAEKDAEIARLRTGS